MFPVNIKDEAQGNPWNIFYDLKYTTQARNVTEILLTHMKMIRTKNVVSHFMLVPFYACHVCIILKSCVRTHKKLFAVIIKSLFSHFLVHLYYTMGLLSAWAHNQIRISSILCRGILMILMICKNKRQFGFRNHQRFFRLPWKCYY